MKYAFMILIAIILPALLQLPASQRKATIPSCLVQFGVDKVILNLGFTALNGSNFKADISDCRYSDY